MTGEISRLINSKKLKFDEKRSGFVKYGQPSQASCYCHAQIANPHRGANA